MKRTLPWTSDPSPSSDVFDATIFGRRGTLPVLIAEVMDQGEADFIVRAANCHDELMAAITEAESGIAEAVRIMDLMGRGQDARNLAIYGNNLRAAARRAGAV